MRCGLVRLVTRKSPYEWKIRRKCLVSNFRSLETGALEAVADSRAIGRQCAHKSCRLLEKISKLNINKIRSNSDIYRGRISQGKTFYYNAFENPDLLKFGLSTKNYSHSASHLEAEVTSELNTTSQFSKLLIRVKRNAAESTFHKNNYVLSKLRRKSKSQFKLLPKKRLSSIKVFSKREFYSGSNSKTFKRYSEHKNSSAVKTHLHDDNLYCVNDIMNDDQKTVTCRGKSKRCDVSKWPYEGLDQSDCGQGFLDASVLNHLNETSYLSLCGCPNCDRKLKKYERKNTKINRILQNKLTQIFNYCKNKYPFYKIQNSDQSASIKKLLSFEAMDRKSKHPDCQRLKNNFRKNYKICSASLKQCKSSQTLPQTFKSYFNMKLRKLPYASINRRDLNKPEEIIYKLKSKNIEDISLQKNQFKKSDASNLTDDPNKNSKISSFDEYMTSKYEELNKKLINEFRYFNDKKFNEITKNILSEKFKMDKHQDNRRSDEEKSNNQMNVINREVVINVKEADESLPSQNNSACFGAVKNDLVSYVKNYEENKCYKNIDIQLEKTKNNSHLSGPLDRFNDFAKSNTERYKQKIHVMQIDAKNNWKRSLTMDDNIISETFDVSRPHRTNTRINIERDKTMDLSKYSEINVAIEKVKKRIYAIINEVDDNPFRKQNSNVQCKLEADNNRQEIFPPRGHNQKEFLNESNYDTQKAKCNIIPKYYNDDSTHHVENQTDKKTDNYKPKCSDPPSSVHLNEIIRAVKVNNTDRYPSERCHRIKSTVKGSTNQSRCFQIYCTQPLNKRKKSNLKCSGDVFKMAQPVFNAISVEKMYTTSYMQLRCMSTNQKSDAFEQIALANVDKQVDQTNVLRGHSQEVATPINKPLIECLKNDEKVLKQEREKSHHENYSNKQFSKIEYITANRNCQEELVKKSLDIFSMTNNDRRSLNKTEYSKDDVIPGVLDRYGSKMAHDKSTRHENQGCFKNVKRWKIWDSNHWKNEADNLHAEMIAKGVCKMEDTNCRRDEIIFNEKEEKMAGPFDSNCEGKGTVINNGRCKFDSSKCLLDSRLAVEKVNCINVGDLALNYTPFNWEETNTEEKKMFDGGRKVSQDDFGKCLHVSEKVINNTAIDDASKSTKCQLGSSVSRDVKLRPCKRNETYLSPFKFGNSVLMDNKNTFKTTTGSINIRRASSGVKDSDFKRNLVDRLKDLKRIDEVNYSREERSLAENQEIKSLKIKESYSSGKFDAHEPPIRARHYRMVGLCSKEVERVTKNKGIGDSYIKKEVTEEMNVSGLFPGGQKFVRGKLVSIIRPRSKFTALKGQNSDRGHVSSLFKEPVTVNLNYETMNDQPTGQIVENAKRKLHLKDNNESKYKISLSEKSKINMIPSVSQSFRKNTRVKNEEEIDQNDDLDKLSRGWKKYNQAMKNQENTTYNVQLKKINKIKQPALQQKNISSKDITYWGAPKSRIYERISNRNTYDNQWDIENDIDSKEKIIFANVKETNNTTQDRHRHIGTASPRDPLSSVTNASEKLIINNNGNKRIVQLQRINNETAPESNKYRIENEPRIAENKIFCQAYKSDNVDGKQIEKPTEGETKYEIDSEDFNNSSGAPEENEKLVVSHFRQYIKPENIEGTLENQFFLEASMLTVTLAKNNDGIDADQDDIRSIENISNQVERELDYMAVPHMLQVQPSLPVVKTASQTAGDRSFLKPKDHYINMINRNLKNQSSGNKIKDKGSEENKKQPDNNQPSNTINSTEDNEIKILKTDKKKLDDKKETGESVESLYLEQICFLPKSTTRQTYKNKLSVTADKVYMDGSYLNKLKGLIGVNAVNEDAKVVSKTTEVSKNEEKMADVESSTKSNDTVPFPQVGNKAVNENTEKQSFKENRKINHSEANDSSPSNFAKESSDNRSEDAEVKALSNGTDDDKDALLNKILKKKKLKDTKTRSSDWGRNKSNTHHNYDSSTLKDSTRVTPDELANDESESSTDHQSTKEDADEKNEKHDGPSGNNTGSEQSTKSKSGDVPGESKDASINIQAQNISPDENNRSEQVKLTEVVDNNKNIDMVPVFSSGDAKKKIFSHYYSYDSITKPKLPNNDVKVKSDHAELEIKDSETESTEETISKVDEKKSGKLKDKMNKFIEKLEKSQLKSKFAKSLNDQNKNNALEQTEPVNIHKSAHEISDNSSDIKNKAEVTLEAQSKDKQGEEKFEIMSSSFTQYETPVESKHVESNQEHDINKEDKNRERKQIKHDVEKDAETTVTEDDDMTPEKIVPVPPPKKKYKQFKKKPHPEDIDFESWDKQATYIKNLRPGFYAVKKSLARNQMYDRNEKKYQKLKLLNKITNLNKVAGGSRGKEKWVADMCCSVTEPKQEKQATPHSYNPDKSMEKTSSKTRLFKHGRGNRSTEWPENLSRKKENIIKQPASPKPRWRN